MGRRLVIPTRVLTGDNISSVTNDAGTGQQYQREVRRCVPSTDNIGKLRPVPMGIPDDDLDLDIFVRGAGDPNGGARWGHKDDAESDYKGKFAAHILEDPLLVATTTSAASKPTRPKMLALASGDLLCMWVQGSNFQHAFFNTSGLGAVTTTNLSSYFAATTSLVAVDAVQYNDTEEVVIFAFGWDSTNYAIEIVRFTSSTDSDPLKLRQTPCEYTRNNTGLSAPTVTDAAVEMLPNGRLAMLVITTGVLGSTTRAYSTDRGAIWSTWKAAGSYGVMDSALSTAYGTAPNAGGVGSNASVDIVRLDSGSLLAVCSAKAGIQSTLSAAATGGDPQNIGATAVTNSDTPVMRLLVSDDGDNWADMVTMTATLSADDIRYNTPHHIYPEGMNEGAVVVGDDGLPRMIGCVHGDANARSAFGSTTRYDDLCMLTLRKADVTGRDVGPVPTSDTNTHVTVSDAFESDVSTLGLNEPTRTQLTAHRFSVILGSGTNDLDSSPTYKGPVSVAAVNWRGAIWLMICGEDTANTGFSLVLCRCNAWSELQERPDTVDLASTVLRGKVYTLGYMPFSDPDQLSAAWVKTGAASPTLDAGAGTSLGLQFSTVGAATYWNAGASLSGTLNNPVFFRCVVKPTSGGRLTNSDIAIQCILSNAGVTDEAGVGINFTTTGFRVLDMHGTGAGIPSTIVDVTGEDFVTSNDGVEVVAALSDWDSLIGVFYRPVAGGGGDPEDYVWKEATGANTLTGRGSFVAEVFAFGDFDAASTNQTWREVFFTRGTGGTTPRLYLFNGSEAWDAANPIMYEFTDDPVPAFDDGMRHGTRAPVCRATPQYIRDGAYLSWRGNAGSYGDFWDLVSGHSWGAERACKPPVRDIFRSASATTQVNVVFDAGATGEPFKPEALALFKVRAWDVRIQLNATDSWGAPSIDVECSIFSASCDAQRAHYIRAANSFTVEGAGDTVLRFTGDTAQSVPDHYYKSTDAVAWYMYSSNNTRAYKVIDNEGDRFYFEEAITNADTTDETVTFYNDKVFIDLANVASLAAAGYRYMRIRIPTQTVPGDLQPDGSVGSGYHTIGLVVAGDVWDLTDPHPDWGWQRRVQSAVARRTTRTGYVDAKQLGPERNVWQWGFNGLRGRANRASIGNAPTDRAGYERLLAMLKAIKYGETVCALMPLYSEGDISVDGGLTPDAGYLEVFPVRVFGPANMSHVAYECALTDSEIVQAIYNIARLTFEEVL